MIDSLFFSLLVSIIAVSSFKFSLSPRHPTQFKLLALKFDPETFISVSLVKPFGLTLEEVEENGKQGVLVDEVKDGIDTLLIQYYNRLSYQ